jgi:hypothetical protein
LRKHVRASTKNFDDDASLDSGRSTRDEVANKYKQMLQEIDNLRKRNEELEKGLPHASLPSPPDTKTTTDALKIWQDIEVNHRLISYYIRTTLSSC